MDTKPMAAKNDFLQPLLDLMQRNADRQDKRLDDLAEKIDNNTRLTEKALDEIQVTNGNVDRHEQSIDQLRTGLSKVERKSGRKTSIEFSPRVIYLLALGAVLLLAIIASLLHIDLGGLLK